MMNITTTVDVRIYLPKDKRPAIFEAFDKLASGETMELINDHDPRPLYDHLSVERPNQFEWEYLEQGPELWRIGITKK
ncbi:MULTISPECIES: DUF2249 domain-containing protein [unclassified Clostridium]|uniref:DUF2249 domain-containing protein n=1 Tax=unclassified Clostridium TaxID=2614128 RepID=UPI00029777B8|nr:MULTISPECIES: DUF2249 domain-containing protein [unclassified Clostridium]EKQ57401.1 MAG: hypothetical protein A370_00972 [Clostridium sp. Maddingley MBC34-26]